MTIPPEVTPWPTAHGAGTPGYGGAPGKDYPGHYYTGAPPQADGLGFLPAKEYSSPGGRALAEAGERLLARIIDGVVLAVPTLLLYVPIIVLAVALVGPYFGDPPPAEPLAPRILLLLGLFLAAFVVGGFVSYLYEVAFMARTGQTLGKRVMKIRVVRIEDGGPISAGQARRRWLANEGVSLLGVIPGVGTLTGLYGWVNSLWLLWDRPHRQCLHDKYAKTAVVRLTAADIT